MFVTPDAPVRQALHDVAALADDEALLKGSVPQPADWLRAWWYLRQGSSFREGSKLRATEQYINSASATPCPSRTALQSLQEVLSEQAREEKRVCLKQAVAITLSFDSRAPFKALRFRMRPLSFVQNRPARRRSEGG